MFLLKNVVAHRVVENQPRINNKVDHKDNLMLLHGSTVKSTAGILQEGFRNSEKGRFGRGLYLTACSDVALTYCHLRTEDDVENHCLFIGEVLNSKAMEWEPIFKPFLEDQLKQTLEEYPFSFFKNCVIDQPEDNEENFKKDEKGRIYRFAPFKKHSWIDQYRVDAPLFIPRYYLEFEKSLNEENWGKQEKYIEDIERKVEAQERCCSSEHECEH